MLNRRLQVDDCSNVNEIKKMLPTIPMHVLFDLFRWLRVRKRIILFEDILIPKYCSEVASTCR